MISQGQSNSLKTVSIYLTTWQVAQSVFVTTGDSWHTQETDNDIKKRTTNEKEALKWYICIQAAFSASQTSLFIKTTNENLIF
jgi:hypothetical protein